MESALIHGRYSTYTNHSCRCTECREAWRVYSKDLRERRRAGAPRTNLSKSAACRARAIAVAELISLHPEQYETLLNSARDVEMQKLQAEPVFVHADSGLEGHNFSE